MNFNTWYALYGAFVGACLYGALRMIFDLSFDCFSKNVRRVLCWGCILGCALGNATLSDALVRNIRQEIGQKQAEIERSWITETVTIDEVEPILSFHRTFVTGVMFTTKEHPGQKFFLEQNVKMPIITAGDRCVITRDTSKAFRVSVATSHAEKSSLDR